MLPAYLSPKKVQRAVLFFSQSYFARVPPQGAASISPAAKGIINSTRGQKP
jgi:hypothetical protein